MGDAHEQRLVEQFVAHPTVKVSDVAILHLPVRSDVMPLPAALPHRARTALLVSSVPLSLTIMPGLPR